MYTHFTICTCETQLSDRSKRITKKINISNAKVEETKFKKTTRGKQKTLISDTSTICLRFVFLNCIYTAHSLWATRG